MPTDIKEHTSSFADESLSRFVQWLDRQGAEGHDPYDIWSTRYGLWARRLYYRHGSAAAPVIAPLLLADRLTPGLASLVTPKKKFATAHAQLALAYLDLYGHQGDEMWLDRAKALADELDQMKTTGYAGDGWGYPFHWQNRRGLWLKGTPYITVTPYVFEALLKLYEITGMDLYKNRLWPVISFAHRGLNNSQRRSGSLASSYSPLDSSRIVNASAYRAFLLIKASDVFGLKEERILAEKFIQFVLESQAADGSWPYAVESKGDDFVDHFHTCFVLKNLAKIFRVTEDADVLHSVQTGYAYYAKNLFDAEGLPKPFSKGGSDFVKYNLYDFAEAIQLGVLLRDRVPVAFDKAVFVAKEMIKKFQLKDGHFVSSVGPAGLVNRVPYIRWPQAQIFYALTALQNEMTE